MTLFDIFLKAPGVHVCDLVPEPGVCTCVCVCDLWWSESLFVLSSVKASASRRAQPYASHYE